MPRTWAPGVGLWGGYLLALGALMVVSFRMALVLRGQPAATAGTGRPASARAQVFSVLGAYVASTAWLIWLTWITGDRGTAGFLAGFAAVLMGWNFRQVRGLSAPAACFPNAVFNAALCGVILAVVNLRVDEWLAPIYHVSSAEMHRLLPMSRVHLLTVALIGWITLVFLVTKPREARRANPPSAAT